MKHTKYYIILNGNGLSAANHWHLSIDETIQRMGYEHQGMTRMPRGLEDQVRQKMLTWSEHVLSWVDAPALNKHVIRYEDMLAKPLETFTQASHFLELPTDPERIEKAIRFSDFKVLAEQEADKGFKERPPHTERFFRQGKSGDWRDKLSTEQIDKIIHDHHVVMRRFGYLDEHDKPV